MPTGRLQDKADAEALQKRNVFFSHPSPPGAGPGLSALTGKKWGVVTINPTGKTENHKRINP